jgi:hypothetical protein
VGQRGCRPELKVHATCSLEREVDHRARTVPELEGGKMQGHHVMLQSPFCFYNLQMNIKRSNGTPALPAISKLSPTSGCRLSSPRFWSGSFSVETDAA